MPYNDFTLDSIEEDLDITIRRDNLFPNLQAVPEPLWLTESLERGRGLALMSEKARSEYIVAPVLLAVRELSQDSISILSGQRLHVDP